MAVLPSLLRRGWNRTPAHAFAYLGGFLLLVGGGAGSARLSVELTAMAARWIPDFAFLFRLVALGLLLIAGLGGASVLVGGFLAQGGRPRFVCSLFLALGSGLGIAGLVLHLAAIAGGTEDAARFGAGLATVAGVGAVCALLAQVRLFTS